jgi:predicted lactoylglutathione lyase
MILARPEGLYLQRREEGIHGFMHTSGFSDLDGHRWEVFWMDPAAQQEAQ